MNPNDFLNVEVSPSSLNEDICKVVKQRVKYKQKQNIDKVLQRLEEGALEEPVRGRKPKKVVNSYYDYFNDCVNIDKLWTMNRDVEDVLVGISRLSWYKPKSTLALSVKKLIYLFKELEVFTVKGVGEKLELGNTQSKVYMRACCLVQQHLDKIEDLPYNPIEDDFYML